MIINQDVYDFVDCINRYEYYSMLPVTLTNKNGMMNVYDLNSSEINLSGGRA